MARIAIAKPIFTALLIGAGAASCVTTSSSHKTSSSSNSIAPAQDFNNPKEAKDFKEIQAQFNQGVSDGLINKLASFERKYPQSTQTSQIENLHGLSLLMLKRAPLAIPHFRKAVASSPGSTAFNQYIFYNLATAQYEAGQIDDADQTSREILMDLLDADNKIKVHHLKARIDIKKELWTEAAHEALSASRLLNAMQAQEMRENHGSFGPILTQSLAQIQTTSALENLYQEYEDTPFADLLLFQLGSLEAKQGNQEKTIFHLRMLMTQFPQSSFYGPASELLHRREELENVDSTAVGVLLPLKGKFSRFGAKTLEAIEMGFHIFNTKEPDTKIRLIIANSGDDPDQAVKALTDLVTRQHVVAVIGPLLSKGIDQVSAKAQELRVPLISLARNTGEPADFVFQAGMTLRLQAHEIARYAIDTLKLHRFAILYPHDKVGDQSSQEFWTAVESLGGEVAGIESYNPGDTDFRQVVDKLSGLYYTEARQRELEKMARERTRDKIRKRTRRTEQYYSLPPIVDYDAVFIPEEPKVASQIIPTFAYRDVDHIRFLGTSAWNSPDLSARAQNYAENALFVDAFIPEAKDPSTQKFIQDFQTLYGEAPTSMEALAYDAARVLESVLPPGRSGLKRGDVRDLLAGVKNFPGVTGRITAQNGLFSRDLKILTIKAGKIEEISPPSAVSLR